jgi:rfaE bifunctional protein kinase chain/domain
LSQESADINLIESFKGKKIAIVGDLMIDAYIWGEVNRMSPEAPVPVVEVNRREARLGGAGNVALNILALEAEAILVSVSGSKGRKDELVDLLDTAGLSQNGIVFSENRRTTVKTRIISGGEHKLRVDEEQTDDISPEEEAQLLGVLGQLTKEGLDGIILQDYNKGVLTASLISQVIDLAISQDIPTSVDPKLKNFTSYSGCTLFKPNLKELNEGLGLGGGSIRLSALDEAVQSLQATMPHKSTLITLSEHGVYFNENGHSEHLAAHVRDIVDVSGAGDTVIAVATLCLVSGLPMKEIARISNLAGGLVCEKVGVVPIDREALQPETLSTK